MVQAAGHHRPARPAGRPGSSARYQGRGSRDGLWQAERREQAWVVERGDPHDARCGDGKHANRVGAVPAVVAAHVRGQRGLPVGGHRNHLEAAGFGEDLGSQEAPDQLPAGEPGHLRRHLEHGVLAQQSHDRRDIGVLERGGVAVEQGAVLRVGGLVNLVLVGGRLLEPLPSALQHAVHRDRCRAEKLSDLRGPPAQHVAQDQHGALPGGQVLQGGDQGQPRALPRRGDLGWIGRPGADQCVGNGLQPRNLRPRRGQRSFGVFAWGAQARRQRPAAGVLQRAQAGVGRDPVQPGPQRRPPLEFAVRPPGTNHRLLHLVLGIVNRAQHAVAVRQQLRPERVGETREILADCHSCSLRASRAAPSLVQIRPGRESNRPAVHYLPRGFPGQFSVRPGSAEVNADEAPPHTRQGARMSSHQVSGAIAYQEGQGSNQVHRWRAFAVLAVSFFMTVADLAIVNVALPTIGRKLHMPESALQWVVTGYALTFGGFLLLGGRAADLLGRRRILMAGLAVFTAASLGCGLATAEGFLIAMRFLQGLGAAIVLPAALSIVMNMFPEGAERNKALGVWGAIGASGAAVGVMAGGLLTRYAGWQYVFFLNVPIGAAALALAPRIVPESRLAAARRRYDPFGAVAVTSGLSLLVYAVSTAPRVGWGTARTVMLLAVSAALLAAFVVIEMRVEAPLMPLRIFQNKTLAGANAVGVLLGGGFFAYIFIGTLYLQQVLGYSPLKAGLAWLVMALSSVAFAGLSQALVTRGSAKLVMAAGMAMIGGGILWSTQVPVHGQFWASLAGPFIIVGVGTAFAFIPVSIAGLAGVVEREAGLASGLLNTSQQLGGAVGVAIASTIAASHASALARQGTAPAAALTSGFQWAFWACGLIGLAAVPVTYLLVRRSELATAVARASQKPQPAPADV